MGWWKYVWTEKAEDWLFAQLDPQQIPQGAPPASISANAAYLGVFLKSMRITYVRKGLSKFYGTVHSFISLPHRSSSERAQFHVLTTPAKLKDIDASSIDRVIQMNLRLLGPIPYRGGDLEIEIGLFSIKSADLAEPFLSVLEQLSDAAGVAYIKTAMPFIQPLKNGVALLTGSDRDTLEIGMARIFTQPKTGYYVVMGAPKTKVNIKELHVDPNDFRLVDQQNQPISDFPYMVLEIQSSSTRDDWHQIPELNAAYKQLIADVRSGDYEKTKQSLVIFKRIASTCDDLLQTDATRLAKLVEEEVQTAMPPVATGATHAPRGLVAFEKLPLYQS